MSGPFDDLIPPPSFGNVVGGGPGAPVFDPANPFDHLIPPPTFSNVIGGGADAPVFDPANPFDHLIPPDPTALEHAKGLWDRNAGALVQGFGGLLQSAGELPREAANYAQDAGTALSALRDMGQPYGAIVSPASAGAQIDARHAALDESPNALTEAGREFADIGLLQSQRGQQASDVRRPDSVIEEPLQALGYYANEAAGSALPFGIAVAAPPIGLPIMGSQAFGQEYDKRRGEGADPFSAAGSAGVHAAAEIIPESKALEVIRGKVGAAALSKLGDRAKETIATNALARGGAGALAEGASEVATQISQDLNDIAMGDDISVAKMAENAKDAFLTGAVMGGPAAAAHAATQNVLAADPNERIRRGADAIIGRANKPPEIKAIEEGKAVASAIFDDHSAPDIPGVSGTAIDTSTQVDLDTGLPPIGVAPEPTADIDAGLADIAPPVATEPEPAPAEQPVVSAPEPIRGGTEVDAVLRPVETPDTPSEAATTPSEPIEPQTVNQTDNPIHELPVADLKLSEDVPQFKSGADEAGVVEALGGTFDRRGTGPIQVWRRLDGSLEVISGRHRLDLARRSGEATIPAQVYDEANGFDAEQAASLDAELNIRDGQGKVKDYVQFFNRPAFQGEAGRQEANARGLLARSTGKRAYTIAGQGTPELIAAHSADRLSDEQAVQIAQTAPNDAAMQALGMKMVQAGKPIVAAVNTMRAVRSMGGERVANGDMFGFDDSAIREAMDMAGVASRKQREIAEQVAAVSGASKRPDVARKLGVNVDDPAGVQQRVAELKAERNAWENWDTDPAKIAQIREELGLAPQQAEPDSVEPESPPVDDQTRPMFSKRPGGASGDLLGGPTLADTSQAPTGARAPEPADLFGGPTMGERVDAAERAKDAARDGKTGGREDTGDGGLFDGERPEQTVLRSARKPTPVIGDTDTTAGLTGIAQNDDSFTYGTSDKTTLPDVFRDIEPGFTAAHSSELAEGNTEPAENAWNITTPEGETARVFQKGKEVWIDVSDLKQGQLGQRIYNAVANYAHNTGRVFVGDPAGLSDVALKRRSENMLSSALKFGTTDHLHPHERQLQGNAALGVPPLKWKVGDTAHNIRELARVTQAVTANEFPEIGDIRYNPETFRFENADGAEVTDADFDKLADQKRRAAERSVAAAMGTDVGRIGPTGRATLRRSHTAGSRSLKRAVLVKQLSSGEGGALARLLAEHGARRTESASGQSLPNLKGLFYSKTQETPANAGVSRSGEPSSQAGGETPNTSSPKRKALTLAGLKAAVTKYFGSAKIIARLVNRGSLKLVTAAEAAKNPAVIADAKAAGVSPEEYVRDIKGFHDGKQSHIITDNVEASEVPGLLLHEVGVHHTMEAILGKERFAALQKAMERLRERGDADVVAAYQRAIEAGTNPKDLNHEAIAYLAEDAPNHSVTQRLVDGTKLFLNRLGIPMDWLKAEPAAIRRLAMDSLRAEARGHGRTLGDPTQGALLFSKRKTPQQAEREAGKRRDEANRSLNDPAQGGAIGWNYEVGQWEGSKGTRRRARAALDDKMLAWQDVQESIAEHLGDTLPDAQNVYRMENLMHGRVKEGIDALEDKRILPLMKAMRESGIDVATLEEYLYARHAKERNAQIAAINPAMPDGGSGMTNAEADAILAKPLPRGMLGTVKKVDAIIRETRQRQLDHGLITQQQFDAMGAQYKHYVPLRGKTVGENEFDAGQGMAGRGIDGRAAPIKQAYGRGAGNRAENILGEIIGDAQRSIIAAEKARVGRTVMRIVLANPNPKLWTIEPVQTERKLDANGEVYEAVVHDWSDPSIVAVRHKGKLYKVQINHAPLAKALNLVGVDRLDAVTRAMGSLNRYFSAVLTRYNPAFIPVNAARDALFGLTGLAVEHGELTAIKAALYYPKAIQAAWKESRRMEATTEADRYAREFAEDGGKTGYVHMPSVEDLQRKIGKGRFGGYDPKGLARAAKATADMVGAMNDSVENALRLSTYVVLREKGMSREAAAEYAKNVTVNFNRKGEHGTKLNSWFLFYNASIQGAKRAGSLMKHPKTWGYLGTLAAAQVAAVMYGMGAEDDDGTPIWDKIPDYVKQRNLVFTWLDDEGEQKIFTIPMPYGFNIAPYLAGRVTEAMMHAEDRPQDRAMSIAADAVSAAVQSFSPVPLDDGAMGLLPTALRIPLSIQVNRDDFGYQIHRDNPFGKFDVPRSTMGKPDTLELFTLAAKGLNRIGGGDDRTPPPMSLFDMAPEDIEYILDKLGGGAGQFVIDVATLGQKATGEEPVTMRDIPIAKRFLTNVKEPAAQQSMFYDRRSVIERDADIVRDTFERDGADAAIKLLRDTPSLTGAAFRRYKHSDRKKGHAKGGIVVVNGRPQLVARNPDSVYARYKAAADMTSDMNEAIRDAFAAAPASLLPNRERDRKILELTNQRMAAQRAFNAAWNADVVGND